MVGMVESLVVVRSEVAATAAGATAAEETALAVAELEGAVAMGLET